MTFRWFPTWLDEGTAEFYGYTRFDDNKIFLGAPALRYRALPSRVPDSIEEIMGLKPRSQPYNSDSYDAESWALVHLLIYGQGWREERDLSNLSASCSREKIKGKLSSKCSATQKNWTKLSPFTPGHRTASSTQGP